MGGLNFYSLHVHMRAHECAHQCMGVAKVSNFNEIVKMFIYFIVESGFFFFIYKSDWVGHVSSATAGHRAFVATVAAATRIANHRHTNVAE